ncbi:DUF4198 domain-containing protein [Desulfopila sp. IMCC35008]|uniref:DUF4198 domain-containing protein n=1 Tax=Desulfopila sp. IMCC35008 TaxID=2653858 RepID=UPI0013D1104E|nr:DUF4198 domain-containing protein [Desulfopila sp. IMCC35008]
MNHSSRFLLLLLIFTVLTISKSEAHGLGYRMEQDTTTIVVTFSYSDGKPVSYAEVIVWSPADKKVEFQNSRTDKNGRFAFSPDTPGMWRIEMSDGMGHASSAECTINEVGERVAGIPALKQTMLTQIFLGISLIFNIAAVIRFRTVPVSSASASPGP